MTTNAATKARRINPRSSSLAALALALLLGAPLAGCAIETVDSEDELGAEDLGDVGAAQAPIEAGADGERRVEMRDYRSLALRANPYRPVIDPEQAVAQEDEGFPLAPLVDDEDAALEDDELTADELAHPSMPVAH